MNVAMMQPSFLPWIGFFELVYKSDIFVFLDDFQFSVQSYHQRNRLFIDKGRIDWYTAPVVKSISFKNQLNLTRLNDSQNWRLKMWKRIKQNYSKAAFFSTIGPIVERWLMSPADSLAEMNISLIRQLCDIMGIDREFRFSSDFKTDSVRSSRVVDILKWCRADRYYCAKGSFPYMKEEGIFPIKETEVFFQDFMYVPYLQIGSPDKFVPYLSIIDTLMNTGPENTLDFIKCGTHRWLRWDEMTTADITAPDMGEYIDN